MTETPVQIRVGVVNALVDVGDRADAADILSVIDSYLTFIDPTARHRRAAMEAKFKRAVQVQEEYRLFDPQRGVLPAGWAPLTARRLRDDLRVKVELVDASPPPPTIEVRPVSHASLDFLRRDPRFSFQEGVVSTALARRRGIVKVATGGGKTEIAAAIAAAVRGRWSFVVNTTDLLIQTTERFGRLLGEPIGMVGDGKEIIGRVTVVIVNALRREARSAAGRRLVAESDGVLFDECHGAAAEQAVEALSDFRIARWRLGFSATPTQREDRRSVLAVGALGPLITSVNAPELIEAGVLAKPDIRMIACDGDCDKKTWRGAEAELIVRAKARNALVVRMTKAAAKPALVFVRAIKHGRDLERQLARAGLDVAFAHGQSDREAILQKLKAGRLDAVVCSPVWTAGIDARIGSVIIAGGGKSVIEAIQRIGRGARAYAGKTTFEVRDVLDRGNKWTQRHAAERRRAYLSEGHEVAVVHEDGSKARLSLPRAPAAKWISGEDMIAGLGEK